MSVINIWHGAMTSTSFRVVAKVQGATTALLVGTSADLTAPTFRSDAHPPTLGIVNIAATGLTPSTAYFYGIEVDGAVDPSTVGQTQTFPPEGAAASFTFIASACAGSPNGGLTGGTTFWPPDTVSRVSNSPVFGAIAARNPLLFIHLGDLHYRDINVNKVAPYRTAYDDVLSAPQQAALYRDTPIAYMWDDHDYGPDNSNKAAPGRPAAVQVYRERVPSYPLNHPEGIWQSFVIGRVRFVMTDLRSMADPLTDPNGPTKTLTGAEQEAWLLGQLATAQEELIIWLSTVSFGKGFGEAAWDGYPHQRNRLASWLQDRPDIARRLAIISGDWHGMGLDDGSNNRWGGVPFFQCGPLDSVPSVNRKKFSHGQSMARGQYVEFTVTDTGASISLRATAFRDTAQLFAYEFTVPPAAAPLLQTDAVKLADGRSADVLVNYRGRVYDNVSIRVHP